MLYSDYLKSDHWTDLKLRKSKTAKLCFICRRVPDSKNHHHVRYKQLFNVTTNDIRLSCEDCHNFYHAVKNEHPHWKEEWIIRRVRKLITAMRKQPAQARAPA